MNEIGTDGGGVISGLFVDIIGTFFMILQNIIGIQAGSINESRCK